MQYDAAWREDDPQVRAELDQLHPERLALRPRDVGGLRTAFDVVEGLWSPTVERARRLPEAALHTRVDGEFSFVETLRHLLFATDAWITRMVLRVPNYHEWGVAPLPPDGALDGPTDGGPDLDAVLAVRAERHARIRSYLAHATDADLASDVSPPDSRWPNTDQRVLDCFRLVLREEWWHHRYAARDLSSVE